MIRSCRLATGLAFLLGAGCGAPTTGSRSLGDLGVEEAEDGAADVIDQGTPDQVLGLDGRPGAIDLTGLDSSPPRPMDLAVRDLAVPDLAFAPDLVVVDLALPPDLEPPPDLIPPPDLVNRCPMGASSCMNGNLMVCKAGANGVLDWVGPLPCLGGICADAKSCAVCAHECQVVGSIACESGSYATCVNGNQGCRVWSPPQKCADGFCANAAMCGTCVNPCNVGVDLCSAGKLRHCVADKNGCGVYQAPIACADGFCADAMTCGKCNHQCLKLGDTQKVNNVAYTCVADANTCRVWAEDMQPLLPDSKDVTAKPDFSAVEFPAQTRPYPPFPIEAEVKASFGSPIQLGGMNPDVIYLVNLGGSVPGGDVEICATASKARAHLWLYHTEAINDNRCAKFLCNVPYEDDERPPATNVGETVCTRGHTNGFRYIVVATDAASPVTITSRQVNILWPAPVDGGLFVACGGRSLAKADFMALQYKNGFATMSSGTYSTDGRVRACNRFRRCAPWAPFNAGSVAFTTNCQGCFPQISSTPAGSGNLWAAVDLGKYSLTAFPMNAQPQLAVRHAECLLLDSNCTMIGNVSTYVSWTALSGPTVVAGFIAPLEMTNSCFRSTSSALIDDIDKDPQHVTPRLEDSAYNEYQVVFKGQLNFP